MLEDGDVILAVDGKGQAVSDAGSFAEEIQARVPGTFVNFEVLRCGRIEELKVRLVGRPNWAQAGLAPADIGQSQLRQAEEYWRNKFGHIGGE